MNVCRQTTNSLSSPFQKQTFHTPENPYECNDLGEDFSPSSTLSQHLLTHTEKTPNISKKYQNPIVTSHTSIHISRSTPEVNHANAICVAKPSAIALALEDMR